jgi:NADH:ubiquinone oxidoreductase subunit D
MIVATSGEYMHHHYFSFGGQQENLPENLRLSPLRLLF